MKCTHNCFENLPPTSYDLTLWAYFGRGYARIHVLKNNHNCVVALGCPLADIVFKE